MYSEQRKKNGNNTMTTYLNSRPGICIPWKRPLPSPPPELLSEDSDGSEVIQALANTLSQITLADLSDREREEELNPLPVFGPPERPRTPPPAPPSDSDSEDEMAKGIPPPTSRDSPQWNGDGRCLKDWIRQLEMLHEHYDLKDGKKRVQHAVGCIEKFEVAEIVEKFAEAKENDWEKFKAKLMLEYDPDEGEQYGSASKLEQMARKQRPIGDGDYREWKEFRRSFVDEAEKGEETDKNSLFTNRFLVNTISRLCKRDTSKRQREDPYTLAEVVEAVDKLMGTVPIGGIANLYTETIGNSASVIKKEVIEKAFLEGSKQSYDKLHKEMDSLRLDMQNLLQSQTALVQAQSNQYRPPVNNWTPPQNTTYQFRNPVNQGLGGFGGRDLQDGLINELPNGRIVMGASGMALYKKDGPL
ncbi:hypothetical protein BDQ17DRAFT_1332315 [Cyathus striatus]|nr:hypothetical protein BDQ17DRAFT_1332315 [Cyathus striatus]